MKHPINLLLLLIVAVLALVACGEQEADDAPETTVEVESADNDNLAADTDSMVSEEESDDYIQGEEFESTDATDDVDVASRIEEILSGDHRSEANRARDQYRHPVETLTFFGIEPDMRVVEMWPGGGWYTEILAPLLRDEGQLVIAGYDKNDPTGPEYRARLQNNLESKLAEDSATYGEPEIIAYNPPGKRQLGPPGSADMVLTFRSTHGWIQSGHAPQTYRSMAEVLKPGGVLGVVQHRAQPDTDPTKTAETGYVSEQGVIELANAAGLVLAGRSPVNANPDDTKDYEDGVWTLPPTLRLGDQDKEKYQAIGESDRMTLKFIKPFGDDKVITSDEMEPVVVPPQPSRNPGDGQ